LAFDPRKYDLEEFLRLEGGNMLQKVCNIVDQDGFLVAQFKTRVIIVPVGYPVPGRGYQLSTSAPALYRSFNYDDEGNVIASLPEIKEWDETCEALAQGADPDDPSFPEGVPAGLKVANSTYEYDEALSVGAGIETTIYTKTLAVDEGIYLRHVTAGGENIGRFQVLIDGVPIKTKRTWWTRFDTDMWFNTANGGILYQDEETIEVKVKNEGAEPADFESSFGYVIK